VADLRFVVVGYRMERHFVTGAALIGPNIGTLMDRRRGETRGATNMTRLYFISEDTESVTSQ
jgi:hypothetical protein